ncbi:MAG: glycosyltransferase family 2 protein [Fimbriiglobus sp.]
MSSAKSNPTVAAVVVTFNRLALLQECIAALRAQTRPPDEIIVVNNGSTDGTPVWLAAEPGLTVVTQANLGSGGGQAAGIRAAMARGHDWCWSMDDDGKPAADCLAELLKYPHPADWLNALVVDAAAPTALTFGVSAGGHSIRTVAEAQAFPEPIRFANPFNGTLLHRDLIRKIGVPAADLFIWGDEVEFFKRATRLKCRIFTVPTALFFHPSSFWGDVVGTPNLRKFSRLYYFVRNHGAVSRFGNRVRFDPVRACGLTVRHIIPKLTPEVRTSPGLVVRKVLLLAHAVWAAATQDTTRRYI